MAGPAIASRPRRSYGWASYNALMAGLRGRHALSPLQPAIRALQLAQPWERRGRLAIAGPAIGARSVIADPAIRALWPARYSWPSHNAVGIPSFPFRYVQRTIKSYSDAMFVVGRGSQSKTDHEDENRIFTFHVAPGRSCCCTRVDDFP